MDEKWICEIRFPTMLFLKIRAGSLSPPSDWIWRSFTSSSYEHTYRRCCCCWATTSRAQPTRTYANNEPRLDWWWALYLVTSSGYISGEPVTDCFYCWQRNQLLELSRGNYAPQSTLASARSNESIPQTGSIGFSVMRKIAWKVMPTPWSWSSEFRSW